MKWLNELIRKVGADKVMHFLVGALIVAQFDDFGLLWGMVGLMVCAGVQLGKERWLDVNADYWDAAAGVAGGLFELLLFALKVVVL